MVRKCSLMLLLLATSLALGCVKLGLRASPSVFENFASTLFEECDTELAKNSIPAALKLLEGLLKNDPDNPKMLTTLAMGFAGYSLLFVEAEDPERASGLYLRAKTYGIEALGPKGQFLRDTEIKGAHLQAAVNGIEQNDFEAFFWTTMAMTGWINLNLDKPAALGQLGLAETCLKRLVELRPDYLYGLPHILMGVSLSARPPLLGGNIKEAQAHFERAFQLGQRKLLLAQYYFAKIYAVRIQDRELFLSLLHEIGRSHPEDLKEVCLINSIMQQKALELEKKAEELFL